MVPTTRSAGDEMESGMDCSEPTPRVNFDIMQRYVGRKVRLVCKVEEWSGDSLKASTCDGQTVFIKPKQGSQYDTAFVEIEGVVENNTTVQEDSYTPFGDSFGKNAFLLFPSPDLSLRVPRPPRTTAAADPALSPERPTFVNSTSRHEELQPALCAFQRAREGDLPVSELLAFRREGKLPPRRVPPRRATK